ncbi:MAG: CDP-glucose 4,6-dehydratase [Gammaproteobacteria bacterium]
MIGTEFWKGKSVLVTGHTGFKGSWLSLWLSHFGANVHGYALDAEGEPNLYQLASVGNVVNSSIGDIRNPESLNTFVASCNPEIIFHLAAQPLVRLSFQDPAYTVETNVMGTVNILEAARKSESTKAMVIITTDKCYENKEWNWGYRENEALGGHDPYSASKACAELITQSWRLSFMGQTGSDSHACAVATARAGNVIGGGDWSADRLIPTILDSITNEQDIILRHPNAIRPWQHVLEPLAGYLLLAEKLFVEGSPWATAWNFGPMDSDAKPVNWITNELIKNFESSVRWTQEPDVQLHEASQLKLDCSKAREVLGWSPVWNLSYCLEEIVRWHQAHQQGANMQDECISTIERYNSAFS